MDDEPQISRGMLQEPLTVPDYRSSTISGATTRNEIQDMKKHLVTIAALLTVGLVAGCGGGGSSPVAVGSAV